MTVQAKRRSRALPADIKAMKAIKPADIEAMKAIKRAVDVLELHEKQRVMDWANAYVEGVGIRAAARYEMALQAILRADALDAKVIAEAALGKSREIA